MRECDVLVVGGGPAGITVAEQLVKAGKDVLLVERSGHLGGRLGHLGKVYPDMTAGMVLAEGFASRPSSSEKMMDVALRTTLESVAEIGGRFVAKAIEEGKEIEIGTKAIVLATGLDPIDVSIIPEFGYGRFPDVMTSLELEEMVKEFDPVGVRRPSDGKVPRTVVFIQCVGSRVETRGVSYCSSICCLNAIKNATLIREALPQVGCYVLYIDVRTHGRGYERAYKEARAKGVRFIRGQPSLVRSGPEGKVLVCGENTLLQELYEIESGLVVLSVGLQVPSSTVSMLEGLGIGPDREGLVPVRDRMLRPCETTKKGVFLAGSVESPKDIRDSILHAEGCTVAVLDYLDGRDQGLD